MKDKELLGETEIEVDQGESKTEVNQEELK